MNHPELQAEVARRRTFAIISHPDAGKTTLTEKLLLYGGAIRQAGSVKARKAGIRQGGQGPKKIYQTCARVRQAEGPAGQYDAAGNRGEDREQRAQGAS